jgi:LysR family glycine cleavage system transcriptional activator
MPFRSYDALRIFAAVAQHQSITAAAAELNLSKGSVSYQVRKLEDDLGFRLFERQRQRLRLTARGEKLWRSSQLALGQLDRDIRELQREEPDRITIGALTYFFSRWLSSRLMDFMEANPNIAVRVEPITGIADLGSSDIDVAICWGSGEWTDFEHELLFECPARPTANASVAARVREIGLERALVEIPLLADSSGSTGWREWHDRAGLDYRPMHNRLVIPDSNDRVQAVIDGQGIALWDSLVQHELDSGELCYLSDVALEDAGYYLVYTAPVAERSEVVATFADWISQQN